jgi:hypothetical protein
MSVLNPLAFVDSEGNSIGLNFKIPRIEARAYKEEYVTPCSPAKSTDVSEDVYRTTRI